MINCYAIAQLDKLDILKDYCVSYPITSLLGHAYKGRVKPSDLLDLGVQLLFIDESLKIYHKSLLGKLPHHITIIYLSDDVDGAFDAFEEGALDFLIFPFSFTRFELCMNKLVKLSLMVSPQGKVAKRDIDVMESFFIKPDPKDKIELLINCSDVLFVEAYQNDVAIQMADGRRFVCYYTMREMEENLSDCFLRVHKSFIINYKKITAFDGANILMQTDQQFRIPLGGVYRKTFLERRSNMVIRKPNREIMDAVYRKALSLLIILFTVESELLIDLVYV